MKILVELLEGKQLGDCKLVITGVYGTTRIKFSILKTQLLNVKIISLNET